ncbi:MAG TPA: protein kinase [Bryobacteraceae bacterium]
MHVPLADFCDANKRVAGADRNMMFRSPLSASQTLFRFRRHIRSKPYQSKRKKTSNACDNRIGYPIPNAFGMSPEQTIAHYRITAKIGEGGMGAVYRATDTKLARDVAIKVIPDTFAQDPDRLARFTREAQVLASLNHPNIAAIYGVEDRALVMELVEGATLEQRIALGPIPSAEAMPIVRQLIDALEYAHERGIVHRDLKPANIKITPEGRVKVLDFGLAKALSSEGPAGDPVSSPTLTMRATMAGMIMGTAGYMAPEQARGQNVDKRADIWAFGVVVHEMLTGEHLFTGPTVSDSMAAVLTREPLLDRVPAEFRRLVRLCLLKDARERLRDIGDARLLLGDTTEAAAAAAPVTGGRRWVPWTIAAIAVAGSLALAVASWWPRTVSPSLGAVRLPLQLPAGSTEGSSPATPQAVPSPDGRFIAFSARDLKSHVISLWVQPTDSPTAQKLEKTENANFPFWSPDGQYIAFFAARKLKKVGVAGGTPQTICDVPTNAIVTGDGGSWNADGVILFSGNNGPVYRVTAAGGSPVPVTEVDASETGHSWPQFLPDGRHFLYWAQTREDAIFVQELGSKTRTLLLKNPTRAVYASGRLLFVREANLFSQRLDLAKLQLEGDPVPIAENVTLNEANGRSAFAVSQNGVLIYRGAGAVASNQLTWYDRAGRRLATVGDLGEYVRMTLSPDETRAAVMRPNGSMPNVNTWVMDLATGAQTRVTFDQKQMVAEPVWSPDSRRLTMRRQTELALFTIASAQSETIVSGSDPDDAMDWSPDGTSLLCYSGRGVSLVPLTGDRKPQAVADRLFLRVNMHYSPDGKYVAYQSTESGEQEVYLASMPNLGDRRRISTGGGEKPMWRRDGKEIYYFSADGTLMAVPVNLGATINVGAPVPLFKVRIGGLGGQYAITRDGKRFLVNERVGGETTQNLTIVLNWPAALKK